MTQEQHFVFSQFSDFSPSLAQANFFSSPATCSSLSKLQLRSTKKILFTAISCVDTVMISSTSGLFSCCRCRHSVRQLLIQYLHWAVWRRCVMWDDRFIARRQFTTHDQMHLTAYTGSCALKQKIELLKETVHNTNCFNIIYVAHRRFSVLFLN